MRTLMLLAFALVVALAGSPSVGFATDVNWGNSPAGLTTAEYLGLLFEGVFHRHETAAALNSYNLVEFYPGSTPAEGVLVIIQTWNEGAESDNLRREIRKVADAYIFEFTSLLSVPKVKRHWSAEDPKSHLVVRHVRSTDLRETIAVTISGVTQFDEQSFRRAEAFVKARGGVWGW